MRHGLSLFLLASLVCLTISGCHSGTDGQTTFTEVDNFPLPDERFSDIHNPSPAAKASAEELKLVIATNSDSLEAWTDLAWRLYNDGRYGECEWVISEARKRSPKELYVLWLSGLAAYSVGHSADAKKYLWLLWKDNKSWPATIDMGITYDLLGRIFLEERDLFMASSFFRKARDEMPDNWQIHFLLGITECERGRFYPQWFGDALEAISKARELNPRNPVVLRYYAFIRTAMDIDWPPGDDPKHEMAHEAIDQAIVADPKDSANYDLLGRVFFAEGDVARAVQAFRQSIGLSPESAWPKYLLAKVLESTGTQPNREEAKQLLIQSIAMQPGLMEGTSERPHFKLLTGILVREGKLDQARALAKWLEDHDAEEK